MTRSTPSAPPFEMGPMAGWGAGGAGLSLLENASLLKDQPEEIKHINTVLGAVTGAAMSSKDPKVKATALLSWPIKQMALAGVGKAEQFRQDQSALLDKKMQAAEIDLAAAEARRRAASGNKVLAYSFLIPAILGGGGLAYYAWNKRKRENQAGRYATVDEHGRQHGKKRVKIEVPASALPDAFFDSLVNVEDNPMSRVQLQEQRLNGNGRPKRASARSINPEDEQAYSDMWKRHWSNPAGLPLPEPASPPSLPGQIGRFAADFTGVPSAIQGLQEIGSSGDAMAEGRHKDIGRYALAGLGNLGMGLSGMNLVTAPILGKLLGRERMRNWINNQSGKGLTSATRLGAIDRQTATMPSLARWIYRRSWGNDLDKTVKSRGGGPAMSQGEFRKMKGMGTRGGYDRARDIRYRYNPDLFAWDRQAVEKKFEALNKSRATPRITSGGSTMTGTALKVPEPGMLFKTLLTKGKGAPSTFWGSGLEMARFGANRGVNTAYRAAMLARRNPNMAMLLASLPVAGLGLERDKHRQEGVDNLLRSALPDYASRKGYGGTPISGTLSNLLGMVGANPAPAIQSQL